MIKLENVILASPEQMEFIIQGMRNSMNSWEKSDSGVCLKSLPCHSCHENRNDCKKNIDSGYVLGENDRSLMQRLAKAGTDHRNFMRMMPVYVRITAPLYWWKEFDTYKVGTVANSCSTMDKIAEKEFTLEDFSCEHLSTVSLNYLGSIIEHLNFVRDVYNEDESNKGAWWQMIQLLPSSYNQTRNVMMNYEVLANIYRQQKDYKLDEWREVCKWIESLPYSELITGEDSNFEPYDIDGETAEAIIRSKFPNIDSAKDYIRSRLAEDDPKNFSVGKITSDLITKELNIDIMKQILEENSK